MCPKRGAAGNVNAKFVGGEFGSCRMGTMSVRQGRPGRMTENIVRNGWVESCAGLGVSRRMVFDVGVGRWMDLGAAILKTS